MNFVDVFQRTREAGLEANISLWIFSSISFLDNHYITFKTIMMCIAQYLAFE